MPDVSANASFCSNVLRTVYGHERRRVKITHHLAKLNGRVADLVPNTDGDLPKKKNGQYEHPQYATHTKERRTSLSNFTFALSPSIASSFWPSRSSAKRVAANGVPSAVDEGLWCPGYGDERPEWGGVGA